MSFADLITKDIRLVLLRFLEEAQGYSLNSSILHKLLNMKAGYQTPRDKVHTELCWLQEQGMVTLEQPGDFYVATLTQRGMDVATGAATNPGVNRPSPRD